MGSTLRARRRSPETAGAPPDRGYPPPPDSATIDDGSYNIQPGTSIVYVVDGFKIEVEGSNLYYTFSSDLGAEDGDNGGYTTSVVTSGSALPGSQLTSGNFTSTVTGPITASTDLPVYHYTSGTQSATTTFDGGLVVNFDADDEDSFDSVLDLDGFNFVLAQVLAV